MQHKVVCRLVFWGTSHQTAYVGTNWH